MHNVWRTTTATTTTNTTNTITNSSNTTTNTTNTNNTNTTNNNNTNNTTTTRIINTQPPSTKQQLPTKTYSSDRGALNGSAPTSSIQRTSSRP